MKNKTIILLLTVLSITQIPNIQSAAIQEIEWQFNEQHLLFAAKRNEVALLNYCLDQKVNVNAADSDGMTALMYAACIGHEKIVRTLLEYKQDDSKNRVNVNAATDKDGNTALMWAAKWGREGIVRTLLEYSQENPENKVNVNAADKFGNTALMLAVEWGNANIIKTFAKYNRENPMNRIDVNRTNNKGLTALMLATKYDKIEAVAALLFPFREDEQEAAEEDDYGYYKSREEQDEGCWEDINVNFGKRTP